MKDIKKQKTKYTFLLTAVFFVPVAFLVGLFFYISTYTFQESILDIDSEVINLTDTFFLESQKKDYEEDYREEYNFSVPEADSLSDQEEMGIALMTFEASEDDIADDSLELYDLDYSEDFDEEFEYENLSVYIDKLEEEIYEGVLGKMFLVFIILLGVVLALSYFAATTIIKPLVRASDKQRRFIADASHEIKTPLSLMKSEIEIFQKQNVEESQSENIKPLLNNLLEDIDRLSGLSDSLLSIARLDNSDNQDCIEVCQSEEISSMAQKLTDSFSKKYPEKEISFYSSVNDVNFYAKCTNVKQVIEILVENACIHMGVNKEVKVSFSKTQKEFIINVEDNGVGIKPKDAERVFDRFYRADSSRTTAGTGLGLSIIKELVSKDGGSVYLNSVPGKGCNFKVSYKLKEAK